MSEQSQDSIEESVKGLSEQHLRDLVCRLYSANQGNRDVIREALQSRDSQPNGATETGGKPTQRRGRLETCILCYAEYDENENSLGACDPVHNGHQEIDDSDDFWADHDDDCHGDRFSRDLMEDEGFAEGYIMACCDKRPNESGCTPAAHKPASAARAAKRARND